MTDPDIDENPIFHATMDARQANRPQLQELTIAEADHRRKLCAMHDEHGDSGMAQMNNQYA